MIRGRWFGLDHVCSLEEIPRANRQLVLVWKGEVPRGVSFRLQHGNGAVEQAPALTTAEVRPDESQPRETRIDGRCSGPGMANAR